MRRFGSLQNEINNVELKKIKGTEERTKKAKLRVQVDKISELIYEIPEKKVDEVLFFIEKTIREELK